MRTFLSASLAVISCMCIQTEVVWSMNKQVDPIAEAIMNGDKAEVVRLLDAGASPEQSDHAGVKAILLAGDTNQFSLVEILINHGADIWADHVGGTVAGSAYVSRLIPESDEGQALARVIRRLKAAGYSWPPPASPEVRRLKREGNWPPANARDIFGNPVRRK